MSTSIQAHFGYVHVRQRLSLLFLALFLFSGVSWAVKVPDANAVSDTRRGGFFADPTHGESTADFLQRVGLGMLLPLIRDFLIPFDKNVLNAVVDAFKNSFVDAVSEVERARDAPKGTITLEMMRIFLSRQETIFIQYIQRDPRIRPEWMVFFEKLHHVFDGLAEIYREVDHYGLNLNWMWLSMAKPFIEPVFANITNIFDHYMIVDLLDNVSQMKESIHSFIEDIMSGDQAHVIRMVAQFVASVDWKNFAGNKFEL